jgi:hypothetical protein
MTAEDPGRELKALLEGCPVVSGTRVAPLTSINGGRATDAP